MSTAKSKSTANAKPMTKLEICSAFEKALPEGDSCILQTDTMVVVAFHLRAEGVEKTVGQKGDQHNVVEYAKPVNWRGIQKVVDGQLLDIGTPAKTGKFTMYMSQYIGQA